MHLRRTTKLKLEVSFDEPLNVDWDGNELLLSDVLGTDPDVVSRDMEDEVEHELLQKALEKVADAMGISQSYISRLEKRIMKRLKREIVRMQS